MSECRDRAQDFGSRVCVKASGLEFMASVSGFRV